MVEVVIASADQSFRWLDVVDPKKKELSQLAAEHGLHENFVRDCLDPEHLPKYERISGVDFLILRSFDDTCGPVADEVQELTRKVAIFRNAKLVITVHRKPQPFLQVIKTRWQQSGSISSEQASALIADILEGVIQTYEAPIDAAFLQLEELEKGILQPSQLAKRVLETGYFLKRRASVFKRMLKLSSDVLLKLSTNIFDASAAPRTQDLREQLDGFFFYADQLLEDANNILNLHITLSSQRTNEVMRLLTLFSVFFLPLNFIASIYGMNFQHMPELTWQAGYPLVLGLMFSVAVVIFVWFRRRGWI